MSRTFRTPITLAAVLALLAGPALAQDATPAAPTPPAAAEAPAPVALPQALQEAGLTDVTTKRGPRDGSRLEGKLPDGTLIEAMLDRDGQLRGVKAQGDAALPQALVAQLVPQAVRDNAVFPELGSLRAVFTGERGVMLAGQDAEKNRVHAGFAQDGTLLRFGRGDDEARDHKHRKHEHGKRHDDRRGDRDHDKRDMRGDDQPGAPDRQGAVTDEGALRQALTSAGYTDLGAITQDGPRVTAEATNPEGEAVLVELNPQGRVVRESAR